MDKPTELKAFLRSVDLHTPRHELIPKVAEALQYIEELEDDLAANNPSCGGQLLQRRI